MPTGRLPDNSDPHLHHGCPPGLEDHPLFHGRSSCGFITAESPTYPHKGIAGNEDLERHMTSLGLQFQPTHDSYGAGAGNSYVVTNPTREALYHLGHIAGQEAVMFSTGGKHELLYTNGPNAGKHHPALSAVRFSSDPKSNGDYHTHLPGKGHVTLHFDADTLQDSPVKHTMPMAMRSPSEPVTKSEIARGLGAVLRKAVEAHDASKGYPGNYPWHECHTSYHHRTVGHGVLLSKDHASALFGTPIAKSSILNPNVGSTPTFEQHSIPFGAIGSGSGPWSYYPLDDKIEDVNHLVHDHGYQVAYYGGNFGRPNLVEQNYDTGYLVLPGGQTTPSIDAWRRTKELARALSVPEVNTLYGEGRRNGGLGARTPREIKRAVHLESLAADKQRDLLHSIGVDIPDGDFHRERNLAMADALHRGLTGSHIDPATKAFAPYPHYVPASTALGMVDEAVPPDFRKFALDLAAVLRKALREHTGTDV